MAALLGCSSPRPPISSTHIPPTPTPFETRRSKTRLTHLSPNRTIVVDLALKSIGTPYTWGGTSLSSGFDCSGLVVYAHKGAGIRLPRSAKNQFLKGQAVFLDTILPGDLVFFRTLDKKNVFHVGIFIGQNDFIHAPGKHRTVTRSTLANPYFKKHFLGAKSFLQTIGPQKKSLE